MSEVSKYLCIGPGGRNCVCCFEAPGTLSRKLAFRAAKRKEEKEAIKRESMNEEN